MTVTWIFRDGVRWRDPELFSYSNNPSLRLSFKLPTMLNSMPIAGYILSQYCDKSKTENEPCKYENKTSQEREILNTDEKVAELKEFFSGMNKTPNNLFPS